FLIFDVCGNFEFFEVEKQGTETESNKPVTQQIFEARLHLSRLLSETGEAEDIELANKLLDMLHQAVESLDTERFQVAMHLRYVDEYSKRERWNRLDSNDVHLIEEHLSELPIPESINEMARRFDLMMLKLQIATLLIARNKRRFEEYLTEIAEGLSKKYTIPAVLRSQALIENIKKADFFKGVSFGTLFLCGINSFVLLQVILRYEIERQLTEGDIEVDDIPALWEERMQSYLGLSTRDNYRDGCMQDIHWPIGAFGYFPSYTLGALYAAQLFSAAKSRVPQLRDKISGGELAPLFAWLNEHIWSQASLVSTDDLITAATGEPLNAKFFKDHLDQRYLQTL
ncbi:MAG: hypothetical protein EOO68_25840, partial [Moraxellaceae bacterium]